MIKKKLFLFLFLFSMANSYAIDSIEHSPEEEASYLIRKYAASDEDFIKKEVVSKLHQLYKKNLDNVNVVRMYSGLLSSAGEYNKAIRVLSIFNSKHKYPSLMLNECILKDRVGNYDLSCYGEVIALKKNNKVNDIDYLMALFMISDKSFDKEKAIYMKGRSDNQDLDVFKYKKQKVLKELYPK